MANMAVQKKENAASTILVIAGAAMALVLLGIVLRCRPADWPGPIGDFIPGWPWW